MTARWKTTTIGSVCRVVAGQSPPGTAYNDQAIGLPFYQGKKEFGAQEIGAPSTWTTVTTKIAEPNDILMSVRAPVGPVNFIRERACIGRGLAAIRPSSEIDRDFLFYNLWMRQSDIGGKEGAVFASINRNEIAALEVPHPPLDEQRRIVAALDEAFAAIATATANAEKNLANARKLFEATARSAFEANLTAGDFQTVAVEALAASRKASMRTGPFGSQLLHSEFVDDGIAVLGIDNAVENEFRWGKRRFITEEKFQSLSRFLVHPGDVIITIMGTCGRCAVIPDDIPRAINSKHLFCISLDQNRCLPAYLHAYFLYAPDARAYLEERAQGSIMAGLNMGIIREMPVRLPSLVAQARLVQETEAAKLSAGVLTALYEKKLALLVALKQSLLRSAFAGELATTKPTIAAPANDDFATPKGTAQIIALAYWIHKRSNRDKSYKHVKAQKCLHNIENIAAIDLGRKPRKFPYGPHDPGHMAQAEAWARENAFFEFVPSSSGPGLDFKKLANYDALLTEAAAATKPFEAAILRAIEPLVSMNMEEAELFATVHAAWNNLLLKGARISDDAIVKEARDNWDSAKLSIPRQEFLDTIRLIKAKRMEPNGIGKYVGGGQASLF